MTLSQQQISPTPTRVLTIALDDDAYAAIMDGSMDGQEAISRLQNACSDLEWGNGGNPCHEER